MDSSERVFSGLANGHVDSNATPFGISQILKDNINLVKTISAIACTLGDFLDELNGSSTKLKKISRDIVVTNVLFAMQLNEFGDKLKLLHNYYTRIYIKTKGMVEFVTSQDLIPYYRELIENKDYLQALKEIKSFLDILTRRAKEILDEVSQDNVQTQLEQLKDQIVKLVEKCNLQQLKENITESIKKHAGCVSNHFIKFTALLGEIKTQIDIIVANTEKLKYKKELELQLKDEAEAIEKTSTKWSNVEIVLKEMFDVFAHLEKEVIEKKIPWETHYSVVAEDT